VKILTHRSGSLWAHLPSAYTALILASLLGAPLPAEETSALVTVAEAEAEKSSDTESKESGEGEPNQSEQESRSALPLYGVYDDGFALKSIDDQYQLRFRSLTQVDGKIFSPADQEPARNGIYIPRFRIYLEGQLTDSFEYELSLQRSVEGTFDVLDANVNFVYSKQLQLRIGRALVPYSYAWYDHLEQYYVTPERGLFALNFGLARQAGIFVHGELFQDQLQYAFGGTSGQLSGLADNNTTRDAVGYLNARPFVHSEYLPRLRNLNLGGSLAIGRQVFDSSPLPLRTSIQTSENDEAAQAASSIFLEYNSGVVSKGERLQGALHTALYTGPFSIEAEWYAARFGAASDSAQPAVGVPIVGYDVTLAAFVTGESVEDRTSIVPLRPVPDGGCGALEVFARYSRLQLGSEVFSAGLADPNDWTRSAAITDIGFNWYLTRFVRLTFDWQHSMYDSPVLLNEAKDLRSTRNDLFWTRCQLYF
jgi:phosphate-selective porin OprO/OprP